MARPVRFSAMSFAPARSVMNTLPAFSNPAQVIKTDDFNPYRSGDYTVTAVNGTATQAAWNTAGVVLATPGTSATDSIYLAGQSYHLVMPGNQLWFDAKIANRQVSNDYNLYCGLFDNVNPASATNGIYFLKPSGGTTLNFVIKKAGTTTTFQNVGDLARPSGQTSVQDPNGSVGILTATQSGGIYNSIVVTTPGAGYQVAPLVLATGTAGSGAQLYCQIGATSYGVQSFAQATLPSSTGIPYGSLVAPYITSGGSSYTSSSVEVDPILDLQFYFDGKGRLIVGINGRQVMAIGGSAVEVGPYPVTPGSTYNLSTTGVGPNFSTVGTQLTTALAPFQPPIGSFYNIAPQVLLQFATGILNTTANPRSMYMFEYNVGEELN